MRWDNYWPWDAWLKLSRSSYEMFRSFQKRLVETLRTNNLIHDRVERLMTIPGVGEMTALTWVLEIGDPQRVTSIRKAVSYCGLCSAQHESAGKEQRGPISKKRNKHLQTMLIEAAKLALHWNEQLARLPTPIMFGGRWVDPNSIFCRGHQR